MDQQKRERTLETHGERTLRDDLMLQAFHDTDHLSHVGNILVAVRDFTRYWSNCNSKHALARIGGFDNEFKTKVVSSMLCAAMSFPDVGTPLHSAWMNEVTSSKSMLQKYVRHSLMRVFELPKWSYDIGSTLSLKKTRQMAIESWKWLQDNYDLCVGFRMIVKTVPPKLDQDIFYASDGEMTCDEDE
jgi:hypothetical protein